MTNKYTAFLQGVLADVPEDTDPELFAPFLTVIMSKLVEASVKDGMAILVERPKQPENYEDFKNAINVLCSTFNLLDGIDFPNQ